jgi:hypothetical protein
MNYLRSFLPWIVYAAVSGNSASSKQWGSVAALIVAVAIVLHQLRSGRRPDALIIEIGSALFFGALAILAGVAAHSSLLTYSAALSSGALAVIAWISLAIRRPFTLGIARQQVPRELWHQPLFIHTNMVITTVWAASFTIGSGVLALVAYEGGGVLWRSIVQVVAIVLPMVFTLRYAERVRARGDRLRAAHGQAAGDQNQAAHTEGNA